VSAESEVLSANEYSRSLSSPLVFVFPPPPFPRRLCANPVLPWRCCFPPFLHPRAPSLRLETSVNLNLLSSVDVIWRLGLPFSRLVSLPRRMPAGSPVPAGLLMARRAQIRLLYAHLCFDIVMPLSILHLSPKQTRSLPATRSAPRLFTT